MIFKALKASAKGPGELIPIKADVAVEKDIIEAFQTIKNKFGAVHVLINNAGVIRPGQLTSKLNRVLGTNIKYMWYRYSTPKRRSKPREEGPC